MLTVNHINFLVDGGWSEWQNVTECSATCGEGVITQQRTCTQPSPSCGGRDCVGENTTIVSCTECCPGIYVHKLYTGTFVALYIHIYVHVYVLT